MSGMFSTWRCPLVMVYVIDVMHQDKYIDLIYSKKQLRGPTEATSQSWDLNLQPSD